MEAVGEVIAVGPGLTGRKVGDIVGYVNSPMGSYAEEQILPAERVVPIPPSVGPVIAASVMLKGMTTQYLVRRCFKVGCLFGWIWTLASLPNPYCIYVVVECFGLKT